MRASVIVPAYNEEQNIGALLRRLVADRAADSRIDDIVVVASGCTDRTVPEAEIVQRAARDIDIVLQDKREGKASAINVALTRIRHDNVVLVSGDVLPAPGTINALLNGLDNPTVGVCGGRPVPMNDPATFTGYAAHLLWRLHHVINELNPGQPKCGEMLAFRRRMGDRWLVPAIAADSAVDEVSVQALIETAGLRSHYDGEAIIHTWGPSNLRDWFAQRRRINAGHIVYSRLGHRPSTMKLRSIAKAFRHDAGLRRKPHWAAAVVGIEALARLAGRWDLMRGRRHTIWTVASTTKRAVEEPGGEETAREEAVVPPSLSRHAVSDEHLAAQEAIPVTEEGVTVAASTEETTAG